MRFRDNVLLGIFLFCALLFLLAACLVFWRFVSAPASVSEETIRITEFPDRLVLKITQIEKGALRYIPEEEYLTGNKELANSEYRLVLDDNVHFFDEAGNELSLRELEVGDRLFVLGREDIVLTSRVPQLLIYSSIMVRLR